MAIAVNPWHAAAWRELQARRTRLPHALLFTGRQGIGKIDFVRKLAQALACEDPALDGAACGDCRSCRWFATGSHPDYREIVPEAMRSEHVAGDVGDDEATAGKRKPSQEIRIEDVRGLQDFIFLTSHQSRGKTIVFYPAERLNTNAANALLKNLEEPPAGTTFMLVAHRPGDLPATIHSRCQRIALPTPQADVAEQWLREQGVREPALGLAQTGNAPLLVLDLAEDDYWVQRKQLLEGLAQTKLNVLSLAELLRDIPVGRLLGWIQRWTYDLLSIRSGGPIRYNPDFQSVLVKLATGLDPIVIARCHRHFVREQRSATHPLNTRLHIEELLLFYVDAVNGKIRDDILSN